MDLSPLSQVLPTFGAPVLESEYDLTQVEYGRPLKGSSNRQYVRFYKHTSTEVCATDVKITQLHGGATSTTVLKVGTKPVTREMVQIKTPGDPTEIDGVATDWHRRMFFRQYKAFRDGRTAPLGQPIDDCNFISPHIATELKYLGCHTVEQLADASDVLCDNLGNGHELREFARSYCKAAIANKSSAQVNILSTELDKARAEIAELREMIKPQIVDPSGSPIETVKRGPGRPKRTDEEKVITE